MNSFFETILMQLNNQVSRLARENDHLKARVDHLVKSLTDEEIVRISETCDLNHVLGLIDFARAILKKAQEK